MVFQKTRKLWVWCAMAFALVMFLGAVADAQLADLDLLEDDDRSFGASVTAMPDPSTGAFAESRSAIMLLPLQIKVLNFEGGAGAYFTQSIVEGEIATALQWRVQGGPHWGKIGLQFYVEGLMEARHRLCGLRAFWRIRSRSGHPLLRFRHACASGHTNGTWGGY